MSVALITGAAHGQGRAIALALAEDGYDIVALDVGKPLEIALYPMGSTDELDSLRGRGRGARAGVPDRVADVRDDAAVSAAVAAAIERFGRIDVLFNNAGICAYGLAHELTEPEWDAMLDINLKGAWIVARHVIPHMIAAEAGVIVNNSSIAGLRGMGRLSHYAASKWGLTGLTKSWAIELAPHGIRVVSIHPTGVDTPLNDGLAAMEGKTPLEVAEQSAGNLLPVPWVETSRRRRGRALPRQREGALPDRHRVRDRRGAAHALRRATISAAGRSCASACASPAHRLISSASPALRAAARTGAVT